MPFRKLAAAFCLLALGACAATTRFDAAGDVHAFLVAIRDGDRAVFDAHVDKDALKSELRARLIAGAANSGKARNAAVAGALLAGPLGDMAADALLRPEVFRAAAQLMGYSADRPIPDRLSIASGLRYVESDRVCVARKKSAPCLFVFRNEGGVWRLVGYEGDLKL